MQYVAPQQVMLQCNMLQRNKPCCSATKYLGAAGLGAAGLGAAGLGAAGPATTSIGQKKPPIVSGFFLVYRRDYIYSYPLTPAHEVSPHGS